MWPSPQETADLVTFTEEIFDGKLHFLCTADTLTVILLISIFVILGMYQEQNLNKKQDGNIQQYTSVVVDIGKKVSNVL